MRRLDHLLDLLNAEPNDVFLNYALGMEYAALGQTTEAEHCYKKVLELDSSYLGAYYQLGQLLTVQKQPESALRVYREGLEKAKLSKNHKAINEFGEAIFLLED